MVTVLNVGQGDCIAVRCPNGSEMLVDCGSTSGGDRSQTIARVDALVEGNLELLVVTHPDRDHHSYLHSSPHVLEGRAIGQAILGGPKSFYDDDDGEVDQLTEKLLARLEPLTPVFAEPDWAEGNALKGFCGERASVHILAAGEPTEDGEYHNNSHGRNTASVVLLLEYEERRILLTGDATDDTERAILERFGEDLENLDVDVLKVAHHGGDTSTVPRSGLPTDWLEVVRPDRAVISSRFESSNGHPSCSVLWALEEVGTLDEGPRRTIRCGVASGRSRNGRRPDVWANYPISRRVLATSEVGHVQVVVSDTGALSVQAVSL